MYYRFEVSYKDSTLDSRNQSFQGKCESIDVYWVKTDVPKEELDFAAKEILIDRVLHSSCLSLNFEGYGFERTLHAGMTDNRARTFKEALSLYFKDEVEVLSGDLLVFQKNDFDLSFLESKWVNGWIHTLRKFSHGDLNNFHRFETQDISNYFKPHSSQVPQVELISIRKMNDLELTALSKTKLLALSIDEMKAVQNYFNIEKRDCIDVELEIIAQTWSEHCKHKIFAADVEYTGEPGPQGQKIPQSIRSLFKTTIAGTTETNRKPWLLSVFKDNAGIVQFTEKDALCLKVETHNSPSALDPFGGAITGIVGVNRDILGTGLGAKPIFNTNVFCVGPIPYEKPLPRKIHAPKDILEGIRKGVEEGGNQSGIPTVNGAVCFDESYIGKPLVFVGSGGILPTQIAHRRSEEKKATVGSVIYMVGGRIGKDGIHGATFSSLALEDDMPTSVVQLGDPITQKRLTDFLLEARNLNLIETLTDNGAGGLSSSVGEIAQLTGGATIDVSIAKTKYPGMAAWERVVSESQERMTIVVQKEKAAEFEKLATQYQVEVSGLGEMNQTGYFEVLFHNETVAKLSLEFLHEGSPRYQLKARSDLSRQKKYLENKSAQSVEAPKAQDVLKQLLSRPNIASKEWIIRQYDHEVQGCSVIKPLQSSESHSSPNNSGLNRIRPDSNVGVVVSCGLQPEWSRIDTYLMAQAAVDEAVRNALCNGAEYSSEDSEKVFSLVDNFCWPDPTQKTELMGDLVRACFGMREAALELKLPFISGKDSMKNDYRGEVEISVVPTLLITAMARISNVAYARSSEFKNDEDVIYILGPNQTTLAASEWSKLEYKNEEGYELVFPQWNVARNLYNWLGSESSRSLRSLHDLSEGGLLTAIAECTFTRQLGCELEFTEAELNSNRFLFGEGFHRFIATVSSSDSEKIESEWTKKNIPFRKMGRVTADGYLRTKLWSQAVGDLEIFWKKVPQ